MKALSNSGDSRDFTKDPPAYLPPKFVLRMQARAKEFAKTGIVDWMGKPNSEEDEEHEGK